MGGGKISNIDSGLKLSVSSEAIVNNMLKNTKYADSGISIDGNSGKIVLTNVSAEYRDQISKDMEKLSTRLEMRDTLNKNIERYEDRYDDGKITEKEFNDSVREYRTQLASVENDIRQLVGERKKEGAVKVPTAKKLSKKIK